MPSIRNHLQKAVTHPQVNRALKICTGLLDVAYKIGEAGTNPFVLLPAAGSVLNVIKDAVVGEGNEINAVIRSMDLQDAGTDIGFILMNSGILDLLNVKILVKSDWAELFEIGLDETTSVFLYKAKFYASARLYHRPKEGHVVTALIRRFFDTVGGLGVEVARADADGQVSIRPIPDEIFADHEEDEVVKLADFVGEALEASESPAFLYRGPFGTGKTTIAISLAQLMGKSVILVGPQTLETLNAKTLFEIIDALIPGMVILDDIDKCTNLSIFYTALNQIRARHPKMTVIVTANEIKGLSGAFCRPGRGGRIVEFKAPDLEKKVRILMKHAHVEPEEARMLAEAMEAECTHDWVRDAAWRIRILAKKNFKPEVYATKAMGVVLNTNERFRTVKAETEAGTDKSGGKLIAAASSPGVIQ
jgi:hypothetical protein